MTKRISIKGPRRKSRRRPPKGLKAARRRGPSLEKAILQSRPKRIHPILAAHLDAAAPNREVFFSIAWSPVDHSPVDIQRVAVGGKPVDPPPPAGVVQTKSAFSTALGSFAQGATLQLTWRIQALNELKGAAAYACVDGGTWEQLDTKVPLAYQETWDGAAPYTVP